MQNKGEFKNGQKIFVQKGNIRTYFFKSGVIRAKGKFINNMMEGKWIFNRESGALWGTGNFSNNEKHGKWIRYDKKGKLEYDADFKNNKLIKKRI